MRAKQLDRRRDAILAGHDDVERHQIGAVLLVQRQELAAVDASAATVTPMRPRIWRSWTRIGGSRR